MQLGGAVKPAPTAQIPIKLIFGILTIAIDLLVHRQEELLDLTVVVGVLRHIVSPTK